jgi:hypothetical protein
MQERRGGRERSAAWRVVAVTAALYSLSATEPAGCTQDAAPRPPPPQQQMDMLAEQLLGEGVNQYMHLLDQRARARRRGDKEHEFVHHYDACARFLRTAARMSHHIALGPKSLEAMDGAEKRRINVGQQAMLFLGLVRELQGRPPQARQHTCRQYYFIYIYIYSRLRLRRLIA